VDIKTDIASNSVFCDQREVATEVAFEEYIDVPMFPNISEWGTLCAEAFDNYSL
jgi:hypothetical protein